MYEELMQAMVKKKPSDTAGPQISVSPLPPPPPQMGQQMGMPGQMGQPPMGMPQQGMPPMGQPVNQMGQQPQMPPQQQQAQFQVGPLGMAPGTPTGPPAGIPPLPGRRM